MLINPYHMQKHNKNVQKNPQKKIHVIVTIHLKKTREREENRMDCFPYKNACGKQST